MCCIFVSDLHGDKSHYRKLFAMVRENIPSVVFLGGDLLPKIELLSGAGSSFINNFLAPSFSELKSDLGERYPHVFIILGNDDPRVYEKDIRDQENDKLWEYVHNTKATLGKYSIIGYAFVPPSPFQLKDWERYDVSRFTDPGCVSPEEGFRTVEPVGRRTRYRTIAQDLEELTADEEMMTTIMLFHTPPYQTKLDRAALDGKMVDYVPLDPHIGSIAVRRLIEKRQPLLTLHGHVHESAGITGSWRDQIGRTHLFTAAHDGPELAVVRFDPEDLKRASRTLI